jgi:hypothetical protein
VGPEEPYARHNGVTFQISQVQVGDITDGLSKTLMIAEKYLMPDFYSTGTGAADDQNIWCGIDPDVNRFTGGTDPAGSVFLGSQADLKPLRDRPGVDLYYTFGSSHPAVFNAIFCDISVRSWPYDVDPVVFWAAGGRSDDDIVLQQYPMRQP